MTLLPLIGVLLLNNIKLVSSGGSGTLRLLSYSNPSGVLNNKQCCDQNSLSSCPANQCDPKFVVCLNKRPSRSSCSLVKAVSGIYTDTDTVLFNNTFGNYSNPLHFNFTQWKLGFDISVQVYDYDANGPDGVIEVFTKSYHVIMTNGPVSNGMSLSGTGGTLRVEYSLTCDPGYYGDCSKRCTAGTNQYCTWSGQHVCLPGWTSPNCTTNINECAASPCINGGTCQDGNNSYVCLCPYGYSGQNCSVVITTQSTTPTTTVTTPATTHPTTSAATVTTTSRTQPTTSIATTAVKQPITSIATTVVKQPTTSIATTIMKQPTTSLATTTVKQLTTSIPTTSTLQPTVSTTGTTMVSTGTYATSTQSGVTMTTSQLPTLTKSTNAFYYHRHADNKVHPEKSNNTGAVVGGIIGGIIAVGGMLLLWGYIYKRFIQKNKTSSEKTNEESSVQKTKVLDGTTPDQSLPPNNTALVQFSN